MIENPILTGFNPDPSICRVGDDCYIATSTFEWFPGVQIHHSRDLGKWRLLGRALERRSQLDMRGCQNSAGIWAPCLSHADGKFRRLYTNVHHHGPGIVMDTWNSASHGPLTALNGPTWITCSRRRCWATGFLHTAISPAPSGASAAKDLSDRSAWADFDDFNYQPID